MVGTGLRANYQSRVDWWRGQIQRQRKANLSVTEFCRQLGVSVTTFYYWKKRVHEATPNHPDQAPDERPSRYAATTADYTGWNTGSGGHVPTIIVSATATGPFTSGGNHYGTLRGIEKAYGVGLLGASADGANGDLSPAFG